MWMYIFASHPMIPLLTIPPIAFFMTLSSATLGYFIISLFFSSARPVQAKSQPRRSIDNRPTGSATIGGSGKKALDTGGSVVQDDIPPRTETSTPTFKDGAVLPNTPSAEKGPTLPPSDGSAAHATPSMQQRQPDRGTVAGEGKTSSTTGTTSGSSVTSSTSTAGDDSSESGTVTH
ncbi:hypothetical protein QFC24_005733 [Naganishia onofrii]|uniref:Uncharacterized protein n=1 Tax=Naganishia onofrii TaxID=1851511 RepID=A0ACC2X7L9_9TREE|nr:hypothetical protein QFC24_005733 [Naganishia onofrii]